MNELFRTIFLSIRDGYKMDLPMYIDLIIATITELAVPTAAILLIIYLIRQLRKK